MANWSKRTTQTFKGSKNRITRTSSSKGTSTYSSSKRVGNTRTTQSISSNGKIKIYTTEHHPTLGSKRTTQTLNKTPRTKKPTPVRKRRAKKYTYTNTGYYSGSKKAYSPPSDFSVWLAMVSWGWWIGGFLLLIFGAAWYVWLIFISAFLKFNVAIFK